MGALTLGIWHAKARQTTVVAADKVICQVTTKVQVGALTLGIWHAKARQTTVVPADKVICQVTTKIHIRVTEACCHAACCSMSLLSIYEYQKTSCNAGLRKTGAGAAAQGPVQTAAQGQGLGPQPAPAGTDVPQQRGPHAAEVSRKRKSVRFNIPPDGAHAASPRIPASPAAVRSAHARRPGTPALCNQSGLSR